MKNIYDVIRQKEAELAQLQKEIEALRLAERLLCEEDNGREVAAAPAAVAVPGPVAAAPRPSPILKESTPAWETGLRQFP